MLRYCKHLDHWIFNKLFFVVLSSKGLVKTVGLLVEKGADVNAVNRDGLSALDAASNAATGGLKMPKTI